MIKAYLTLAKFTKPSSQRLPRSPQSPSPRLPTAPGVGRYQE